MTTVPEPVVKLRPPKYRIEKRAIAWWALQSFLFWGIFLGAAITASILWENTRSWLTLPIIGLSVILVVGVVVEPLWRYAVHRWETNDQAVYALTGWLVREWRVAPISRIQTVDAVRGPLEQMLGLSTLRVTTASSKGAINIGGLHKDVAAEIAERLTTITELTPGDAT